MEYRIEAIGGQFSNKDVKQLGDLLTNRAKSGYKLHSVFQAQQPGCLGASNATTTYFAIYVKE
ncbi:hypothetical protein [Gimesia maris]|uniref:hypothetical protein n=1 Tax=Gimesia maris TaxID=122 RepID=UPI00241F4980|nr:hypothetical protein [Gimesia maris]|tara:strand:- start:271 stop:459 length:189 start_codon:yes stop_codon:yes gene_type:complete